MSQFLESIACRNGYFDLLEYHQERVNRTFATFYPGLRPHDLKTLLTVPAEGQLFKFRVIYDGTNVKVEHAPYAKKIIGSLRLVKTDIDYSFKFLDRTQLVDLVEDSGSDDVLIVKNGLITDSSYANLAFFDGQKWLTPKSPLLAGVRRAQLLTLGMVIEADIRATDVQDFEKVSLVNGMLDLGELEIPTEKIS